MVRTKRHPAISRSVERPESWLYLWTLDYSESEVYPKSRVASPLLVVLFESFHEFQADSWFMRARAGADMHPNAGPSSPIEHHFSPKGYLSNPIGVLRNPIANPGKPIGQRRR